MSIHACALPSISKSILSASRVIDISVLQDIDNRAAATTIARSKLIVRMRVISACLVKLTFHPQIYLSVTFVSRRNTYNVREKTISLSFFIFARLFFYIILCRYMHSETKNSLGIKDQVSSVSALYDYSYFTLLIS